MNNIIEYDYFLFESSSNRSGSPKWSTWSKWRSLINMSPSEIKNFLDSKQGKDAGLSRDQAKKEGGMNTGRDSARALIRMIPKGSSWNNAVSNWTPLDWYWAGRQVSFNSRMLGSRPKKNDPYMDENGEYTRWYKSMLIWGHDPKKPKRNIPQKPNNLRSDYE